MIISHKDKMIFFHNPKVVGTSIKSFIEENRCWSHSIVGDDTKDVHPFTTDTFRHLLPAQYMQMASDLDKRMFNDFFKFTFVRNPWDRLVSLFHWNMQSSKALQGVLSGELNVAPKQVEFLEWVGWLHTHFTENILDFNLRPQHLWTHFEGKQVVDFVGRYENLKKDFKVVVDHMSNVEKLKIKKLPHINSSKHCDYREIYNSEMREKVSIIFAQDIELFGYSFEGLSDDRFGGSFDPSNLIWI